MTARSSAVRTLLARQTIAAIATHPGPAGIAVIRISGSETLRIIGDIFQPVGLQPLRRGIVRYGSVADPATGAVLDDVLVTTFRRPHSYTGEDAAEISCHGGLTVPTQVLDAVLQAGARLAEPGEYTMRAFYNGRIDLAQAEAVADIIHARTAGAARLARRQLAGELSHCVSEMRCRLVGVVAALEASIDFPDEVGDPDMASITAQIDGVHNEIVQMLESARTGMMIRDGIRAVLIGRPNVGKSSILNALLRKNRAIVTAIPGTTRDILEESICVHGVEIVLVDTAGLRPTTDLIEQMGMDRSNQAAADADILLAVLDATEQPESNLDDWLLPQKQETNRIYVLNKVDAVPAIDLRLWAERLGTDEQAIVVVSAHSGDGMRALEQKILFSALGLRGGTYEEAESTMLVTRRRHEIALRTAAASLRHALETIQAGHPADFIGIDLRGSLSALEVITGQAADDEIIHRIFHDFCVGK